MKINEIIAEGKQGGKPDHLHADTGEWQFRDKGGYDRTYNLNRIMMAAAMADGKKVESLPMYQASWVEKYNVAKPYTEEEHKMMQSAFKTVDSEYKHTESDHKSKELPDTHKVSPHHNPGPVKHKPKSKK